MSQNIDQQLAQLKDDLSRLNQQFDIKMKEANVSHDDLAEILADYEQGKLPKEVSEVFDKAKADAQRAGQAQMAQSSPATSSTPSRARRGAMRI